MIFESDVYKRQVVAYGTGTRALIRWEYNGAAGQTWIETKFLKWVVGPTCENRIWRRRKNRELYAVYNDLRIDTETEEARSCSVCLDCLVVETLWDKFKRLLSVSYTHLDVYKRQLLNITTFYWYCYKQQTYCDVASSVLKV